jgi:hypothetical protein
MSAADQAPLDPKREADLACKLMKAQDAIERCGVDIPTGDITPARCAYIDTQLQKAIAWLASARAIVVIHGGLSEPIFDDGQLWNLDDEVVLAEVPGADTEGGMHA